MAKTTKTTKELGKPVLWRHHMAGVLLGYITPSDVPGHLAFDGVRIRSWSGGRVDCASLAVKGPSESDTITERVRRDVALEASVEIYDTPAEHVELGIRYAGRAR
jgi:hypothetical protein